jgi:hypothetical protein
MQEYPYTPPEDFPAVEYFLERWIEFYNWKARQCDYPGEVQHFLPQPTGSAPLENCKRLSRDSLEILARENKRSYIERAEHLTQLYLHVKRNEVRESEEFQEALELARD